MIASFIKLSRKQKTKLIFVLSIVYSIACWMCYVEYSRSIEIPYSVVVMDKSTTSNYTKYGSSITYNLVVKVLSDDATIANQYVSVLPTKYNSTNIGDVLRYKFSYNELHEWPGFWYMLILAVCAALVFVTVVALVIGSVYEVVASTYYWIFKD